MDSITVTNYVEHLKSVVCRRHGVVYWFAQTLSCMPKGLPDYDRTLPFYKLAYYLQTRADTMLLECFSPLAASVLTLTSPSYVEDDVLIICYRFAETLPTSEQPDYFGRLIDTIEEIVLRMEETHLQFIPSILQQRQWNFETQEFTHFDSVDAPEEMESSFDQGA